MAVVHYAGSPANTSSCARLQVVMRLTGKGAKELTDMKARADAVRSTLRSWDDGGASGGPPKAGATTAKQEGRQLVMEMFRKTAELKAGLVAEHLVRSALPSLPPLSLSPVPVRCVCDRRLVILTVCSTGDSCENINIFPKTAELKAGLVAEHLVRAAPVCASP